jgi:cyclophilin family peptidyl-prolyl cis-trans isomerase
MVSKKIEQGWLMAEKQIKLENPVEALEILRETDVDATEPKTWRLAGEAKTMQARQSDNDKRLFKEAVGHYESALKSNPSDKTARRSLNSLRSEMDGLGIRAGGISLFIDDGAPTFIGMVSIVVAIGMVLVGLKVIPEYYANYNAGDTVVLSGSVLMEISWTDTSGNSHNGKIWIDLYDDETPMHAASFRANTDAARYDGTIFHRIVDGFMIQGGDFENGDGTGGHAGQYFGYCADAGFEESTVCKDDMTNWVIPAEFGQSHDPGVIAAARSGAENSAGSQFYLVDSTGASQLDGQYTAFGKAYKGEIDGQDVDGITVIDAISQVGCGQNQDTCTDNNKLSTYPVTIESVTLID